MLTSNRAHAAKLNVFSGASAVFAMRPGPASMRDGVRRTGFGFNLSATKVNVGNEPEKVSRVA